MMNEDNGIDYSDQGVVKTLKETVARGVNESEYNLFVEVCKSTGLNPFKREIWCIKTSSNAPVQVMTGINGFHAIATRHPAYDGMETSTEGEVQIGGGKVAPFSATAIVYRKDRRVPMRCVALWSEYGKFHGVWKQMPTGMLLKCAESLALRKSFPQEMNGVYTVEEMPQQNGSSAVVTERAVKSLDSLLPPETKERLDKVLEERLGGALIDSDEGDSIDNDKGLVDELSKMILMSRTISELELIAVDIGQRVELSAEAKSLLRGLYQTTMNSLKGG